MEAKTEPQKRAIPPKALYFTDMRFITNGPAVPASEASANEVRRVNFVTADGQELLGFYKPLSRIYPELLAKYCVATSVVGRMCLGDAISDERLVFEKGKIVGTVSVAIPGFGDPSRKLATELSTDEILNTNIIELLVWMMFIQDDDGHPENYSRVDVGTESRRGKAAAFDWDLCWRQFLSALKTPRYAEIVKELLTRTERDQDFSLTPRHLMQFPNAYDATYWPSRDYPGNLNIAKAWANSKEFAKLNSKEFAAQTYEQMYSAILKIFMLSDPEILEARLKEAFGETLLDFQDAPNVTTSEKAVCASRLMEKAPHLYTTATDSKPFYEHFLAMYKQIMDHWQNVVFSFKDPRETSELCVRAPSFCDFLSKNHSARTDVMTFIEQENNATDAANAKLPEQSLSAPLGCSQFGEPARLSTAIAEQRFLFVWWSSHTEHRKALTDQISKLISFIDADLTYSPDGSTTSHQSDPQNTLAQAKNRLVAFNNTIHNLEGTCQQALKSKTGISPAYPQDTTSSKDPVTQFCDALLEERTALSKDLRLGNGNRYKREEAELHSLTLRLADQLSNPTVALPRRASETRALTDAEAKERLFREFLAWLRKLDANKQEDASKPQEYARSLFAAHVTEALRSYKNTARTHERREKIDKFTKKCSTDTEFCLPDALAFIMSHGGIEPTSLNTFLFCSLLQHFEKENIASHNYNVSSLLPSCNGKSDNLSLSDKYLGFFQTQFLQSSELEHYFSAKNRAAFMSALSGWLGQLPDQEMKRILEQVLKDYQSDRSGLASLTRSFLGGFISTPPRDKEVKKIIDNPSLTAKQKVAKIWAGGTGWEVNSCNTILFKTLLASMIAPHTKHQMSDRMKKLVTWLLNDGYEFLTDYIELLRKHNKLDAIDRETTLSITYPLQTN